MLTGVALSYRGTMQVKTEHWQVERILIFTSCALDLSSFLYQPKIYSGPWIRHPELSRAPTVPWPCWCASFYHYPLVFTGAWALQEGNAVIYYRWRSIKLEKGAGEVRSLHVPLKIPLSCTVSRRRVECSFVSVRIEILEEKSYEVNFPLELLGTGCIIMEPYTVLCYELQFRLSVWRMKALWALKAGLQLKDVWHANYLRQDPLLVRWITIVDRSGRTLRDVIVPPVSSTEVIKCLPAM